MVVKASSAINIAYYVFNVEELEQHAAHTVPGNYLAGVAYEGGRPLRSEIGIAKASGHRSARLETKRFTVLVVIPYKYADSNDTKHTATDLLDQIKAVIADEGSANMRPWVYVGETPLETALEGVIMYGQGWEIVVPVSQINRRN